MAGDYYALLGVEPDASAEDIKRAFRSLARRYHPDATGGDTDASERYKEISEAYAVLSDPARRREYDVARTQGSWTPFASTIEDLFGSFFGGPVRQARTRTRARQGESIEVQVELGFKEAVFGTKRDISFERYDGCTRCGGSGCEPGSHPVRCNRCEGRGEIQQVRRSVLGSLVTAHPCATCQGTGQVIPSPCGHCRGQGRIPEEAHIPLEIPSGIEDGDRLRLAGEGEAGVAGGPRGDLYVRFVVRPDDRFSRAGDDLVTWVEVPMTIAALGGEVSFNSLEGDDRVEVPPGTQSGALFRLRNKGQPRRGGRGRGDLLVRAHVVTPTDLDAEQERLLRRMAEIRGEVRDGRGSILGKLRRAFRLED